MLMQNNAKNTWKIINSVLKHNPSSKIAGININVQSIINPNQLAEHFNKYFTNIGPNLANQIPKCDSHYDEYLNNRNPHTIFVAPVTEHNLFQIVTNLPSKESAGNDMMILSTVSSLKR